MNSALFLSAQNVTKNGFNFTENKFITKEKDIVLRNGKLQYGDIVITTRGTVGNVGYYTKNIHYNNIRINSGMLILRCNNDVNSKYIYYVLLSKWFQAQILSFQTGTAQPQLPKSHFQKMQIPFLPFLTQQKIAKVLSAIDDKIELNNSINSNLEQQAQAIFNKKFINSIYGNNFIGDYIKPKRGKNLLSKDAIKGDVPVVAGGIYPATYHNVANTKAPVITISASGANAGFVNLWHIPIWSSDSSYIDNTITEDVYFWYVLLKQRQQEIFDSQTGSAQPHIYPQHIEAMKLSNINLQDVKLYNQEVTPLFKHIGYNLIENISLTQLRDTLLPKLMNGEIDVSNVPSLRGMK